MNLSLGLGGMRNVASAIISHEQIHSNRVCCLQALDLFSEYLEITTGVVWRPYKVSSYIDIVLFLDNNWFFGTIWFNHFIWEQSFAHSGAMRREG